MHDEHTAGQEHSLAVHQTYTESKNPGHSSIFKYSKSITLQLQFRDNQNHVLYTYNYYS